MFLFFKFPAAPSFTHSLGMAETLFLLGSNIFKITTPTCFDDYAVLQNCAQRYNNNNN